MKKARFRSTVLAVAIAAFALAIPASAMGAEFLNSETLEPVSPSDHVEFELTNGELIDSFGSAHGGVFCSGVSARGVLNSSTEGQISELMSGECFDQFGECKFASFEGIGLPWRFHPAYKEGAGASIQFDNLHYQGNLEMPCELSFWGVESTAYSPLMVPFTEASQRSHWKLSGPALVNNSKFGGISTELNGTFDVTGLEGIEIG